MLKLYTLFHCNLAFSMIPREHFPMVVKRCYTPLLDLAEKGFPIAIEMTAWTLKDVNAIDPSFLERLRSLGKAGKCEFIGTAHAEAGNAGNLVIAVFSRISASKGRSGISPKLRDAAFAILKQARAAKRPSAVISFDSPYILDQFKDADVLITGYDRMDEIQRAAVDLLADKK